MGELHYDDWMSESDSVLWHIERDPLLRSTITSVWFLDAAPDRDRLDAAVERMVAEIPRLHQRVVDDRPGVAAPRWVNDPHVDVGYHYSWARLAPRRDGRRAVLDHAQRFAARSFDRDRPLWEFCVVDGLPGKKAAFILKIHHAIADGLGMVHLLGYIVDLEPDPPSPTRGGPHALPERVERSGESLDRLRVESSLWAIPGAHAVVHRIATDARTGARVGRASLQTAADILRDPVGTLERLGRTTRSIARVVMPATKPLSPLMTGRSITTRFDAITVPFADFKQAARSADGTLNDAFVAVTLDAMLRYHDALGVTCGRLRMNMPVSVREGGDSQRFDNQFVPARIVLPLDHVDPAERIAMVRDRLRSVRAEPALPHVNDISGVIARFGPAASVAALGAMLKGVDVTTSNVPGPPFPVYMAGARVEQFFAFGPLAGAAINITLFSYDGTVHLGVNTDRAAITDHEAFVRCLQAAVDDTVALASAT